MVNQCLERGLLEKRASCPSQNKRPSSDGGSCPPPSPTQETQHMLHYLMAGILIEWRME